MAKPKFKLEWYADEVIKAVSNMTHEEEKAAAKRIRKRARRYVPVGGRTIEKRAGVKAWKSRHPGKLKSTIRVRPSRFREGGFIVSAGNEKEVFYAHFIEYGTIFFHAPYRKGYKFMKKATNLERARFVRQIKKQLGV